ncbi:hypothetical protein VUR80DRAFT_5634 [Thermomyces stellatus]
MDSARGDAGGQESLVRVQHPETIDMVALRDYQRLPTLADLPEAAIQRNTKLSLAQSRIPRLRARRGTVGRRGSPEFSQVVTTDLAAFAAQQRASSQATAAVSPITAGPRTSAPDDEPVLSDLTDTAPSPGGVWATNAPDFASGSHPQIRFVADMPTSEPRLNRDKGKAVDKRYHTEPVAGGKECGCIECEAQKKGLLSSEMIYAYLAMRGAQNGQGLFEDPMAKYRENGGGQELPTCPHARSMMNKQREAASKCEGKGSVANVPRLVRADAGLSNSGPPAASPSVTASPNKIPSIAGLTDFSSFHSAQTFSTDFNLDDVRDGGDVAEGAITPGDFLRMASGVSTAKTDKALPPLPLDSGQTSHEQLEDGNENGNGSENETEFNDRVDAPGYRSQICEETMDALTGSYTVTTDPSMINEPPGVRHLDRLRGAFGNLFSRMQPRLGERLDRIRLGLPRGSDSSLSVLSKGEYTAAELETALASPSATAINGIPPARVQAALAEATDTVAHLEQLEATAHRLAVDASERLELLRTTLSRVAAGATYITDRHPRS